MATTSTPTPDPTPSSIAVSSHPTASEAPTSPVTRASSPPIRIDLRNLNYVFPTDPNLLCPICHSALVTPVQTKCLHTFCSSCISTSLERSSTCPVDRKPLGRDDVTPAPIMIANLVNDLMVLCPNAERGCGMTVPRCLVEGHVREDCQYQPVRCKSDDVPDCEEPVMRKDNNNPERKCVHQLAECRYCTESFKIIDMALHEAECPAISTTCEHCRGEFSNSDIREHLAICPCVIEPCPAATHGCTHTCQRSALASHVTTCAFVQLSPLLQTHSDRISRLELENRSFRKKIDLLLPLTRRAKSADDDKADMEAQTYHLFAEQEHLRGDVDRISAMVADMEVKQAMLLMNENIRYNEEMAGMRLAINALRMQINFLAASRSGASGTGGGGGGGPGPSASGNNAPHHPSAGGTAERRMSGIKL